MGRHRFVYGMDKSACLSDRALRIVKAMMRCGKSDSEQVSFTSEVHERDTYLTRSRDFVEADLPLRACIVVARTVLKKNLGWNSLYHFCDVDDGDFAQAICERR